MAELSKEERQALALGWYSDPVLFCGTALEHWFPKRMPWVHRGILAILLRKTDFLAKYGELEKIQKHFVYKENGKILPMFLLEDGKITLVAKDKIAIMMPRGFSKTTIVNAALIYLIEFQDCKFPLLVSETNAHAKNQLGNVKRELESNAILISVFGPKVPGRQDSEKWTEDMITTTDGITVMSRGRGGQVRGLNYNANRPDVIVVDDLEDKESVSTQEQVKKSRSWFYSDLIPCRSKQGSRIVVLGTLLAKDALLMHLGTDPSWTFVRFGAVDLDGDLLWDENMNFAQIESEKASYALAGNLNEFYMEFMSELRDESTAKFRKEFIQYSARPELVAKAIVIDPAISNSATADDCAIAVVGMTDKGKIHVCDIWGKRGASPREQVDAYFDLIARNNPDIFGVEAIAYQAALIHLLREEMFRRKKYFEIIPITHKAKKSERILGVLQPRYASGYVTHEQIFPKLEQQLLDYDGKGHDDYPDVVAMAVTLLDPYAAQAADSEKDLADDEYEPLDATYFRRVP